MILRLQMLDWTLAAHFDLTCTWMIHMISFSFRVRERIQVNAFFFLQWNLVIDLTVNGYVFAVWHFWLQSSVFKAIGRCQLEGLFLNPWCAVKLTKWRNVICEFTHRAFKDELICQHVIGWPSINIVLDSSMPPLLNGPPDVFPYIFFFLTAFVHFQST